MEGSQQEFMRLFKKELFREGNVRGLFLNVFKADAEQFCIPMAEAAAMWRKSIDKSNHDARVKVTALVYIAIKLYVESMRLFLMGHTIASGNLMRQTVETVALALLCSHEELTELDAFTQDRCATQKSVDRLVRQHKKIGIPKEAAQELQRIQEFFHKMSHPSLMTIAIAKPFGTDAVFIGAGFDPQKLEQYKIDMVKRLDLAKAFPIIVQLVEKNLSEWA